MIGGVASSSLRGADLDDDGVITADEARGTHYQRRLGAQIHQPTVKLGAGVATTRYTPAQEKAIARLLHSREVWSQYAEEDQQAQEEAKQAAKAARREKAGEQISSGTFSVWQAARLGQVEVVQRFIEDNDFDIRKHNTEPVGYGDTLLHTACWHGHVELVNYLLHRAEERFGPDGRKALVNDFDTATTRTTPLMCAARTRVGHLNDRLKIVQLLVMAGADSALQDSYGDNCLHWAARLSSLPIVRYLCKHTEGAVFASVADNYKRKKPLDVAERVDLERWKQTDECARDSSNPMFCTACRSMHYSSVATVEVYRLLLNLLKGCNMRLKIQKGKQRRLADHERVHVAMVNRRDKALRDAMAVLTKAQKEVKRQYEVAEAQRTKEEEEFMDAKGNAAVEELEEFVKTQKEGKRLLKATKDAVFAEMKRELKKKGKSTNRDTARIAMAKAKAQLFKERHNKVAMEAQAEYRQRNPPIKIPKKLLRFP